MSLRGSACCRWGARRSRSRRSQNNLWRSRSLWAITASAGPVAAFFSVAAISLSAFTAFAFAVAIAARSITTPVAATLFIRREKLAKIKLLFSLFSPIRDFLTFSGRENDNALQTFRPSLCEIERVHEEFKAITFDFFQLSDGLLDFLEGLSLRGELLQFLN